MKISPIHPFPARMAPEIAIEELSKLPVGSKVLDPMMGSGTVLRHAVSFGHHATGFDMDPLAVLMSRVWSTSVPDSDLQFVSRVLYDALPDLDADEVWLPWIDEDPETEEFISFWFGERQRRDLRRLAFALSELELQGGDTLKAAVDVLRVALSRIIITKNSGASLAWDVSHSRPHRVMQTSDFEVIPAFQRSLRQLTTRLMCTPKQSIVNVAIGDARTLQGVSEASIDMVLTSPPYLNAIDYLRGHKLSLVWLGYAISGIRAIRSTSIGAERRTNEVLSESARQVQIAMVDASKLQPKQVAMIERYSIDLVKSLEQTARALKPGGRAIYVVGNSCLREVFVRNSDGLKEAAAAAKLSLLNEDTRELPSGCRYLPMPKRSDSALGKRMRTESILTFQRIA